MIERAALQYSMGGDLVRGPTAARFPRIDVGPRWHRLCPVGSAEVATVPGALVGSRMPFFRLFRRRPVAPSPQNARQFLAAVAAAAPPAGLGACGFRNPTGGAHGFVQFIVNSPTTVTIHRLWTLEPGYGNGSVVLRAVCDLADEHEVTLTLKCLPFGRKPYPKSREQLAEWYQRFGFVHHGRRMVREPHPDAPKCTAIRPTSVATGDQLV
jgi:hypothetical protein